MPVRIPEQKSQNTGDGMQSRSARLVGLLSATAVALSMATSVVADPLFTVQINTEITAMTLTGTGPVPLGTGLNQSYQPVQSMLTATATSNPSDPAVKSGGTTTLTITSSGSDSVTVDTFSTFTFYLELKFEDIDPVNDYAGGLTNPLILPAKPLVITLTDSLTLSLADILANPNTLPDHPGVNPVSSQVEYDLGVDINSSSENDVVKYTAENFDLGDDLTFSDDVLANVTLDDILDATFSGNPLVLGTQVSILSGSFLFKGLVADPGADPEFSIQLTGLSLSAPEPGTLLLLALALIGLGMTWGRVRASAPWTALPAAGAPEDPKVSASSAGAR